MEKGRKHNKHERDDYLTPQPKSNIDLNVLKKSKKAC